MMKQMFRFKGINFWLLGAGFGLNFIWSVLVIVGTAAVLGNRPDLTSVIQAVMLLIYFILSFLVAWLISKMAGDQLGPSYGLISSLGGALPVVVVIGTIGISGIILGFTAILGGVNGGLFSMRKIR